MCHPHTASKKRGLEGANSRASSSKNDLIERKSLSPERIAVLLGLCLRSAYFSYGGEFYEQREGAAMGSPVSVVVANRSRVPTIYHG